MNKKPEREYRSMELRLRQRLTTLICPMWCSASIMRVVYMQDRQPERLRFGMTSTALATEQT